MELPRHFLIGAAIGSGSTALAAERGGADLLLAINAGRVRNMGAPSIACMLPILDAGPLTEEFSRKELLALCRKPVLLGVNAWEESCDPGEKARQVREAGFAGATNFPSCMHYSHAMQQLLSRSGRGIEKEVEMLRAVQDAGLMSMFYCATKTQARLAADAKLDLVCLNLGWNVGGATGHRTRTTIEEVASAVREIGRLIKRIHPPVRFLVEGGPIVTAEDLGRLSSLAPLDGYVGGSTIERMPLEISVADQIDAFRQASMKRSTLAGRSAKLVAWARRFGFVGRSKPLLAYLGRLHAMAAAPDALLVVIEPGINPWPTLEAIGNPEAQQRARSSVEIDVAAEDSRARVRRQLFGHDDTAGQNRPMLADSGIDMLVIRAPERLPASTQRRLARALREGVFRASGSRRALRVSPRVVLVTTARPGSDLTAPGLDPDLQAHFEGWTLRVPPLRDRIDDLTTIMESLVAETPSIRLRQSDFTSAALQRLLAHDWTGNETELRKVIGALAGRSDDGPIQPQEIAVLLQRQEGAEPDTRTEKDRIVDALWRNGFNRTRTAEALGMSRKTLYNKIQKFGLAG